jgi:predicted O-methyltransferase YrrM
MRLPINWVDDATFEIGGQLITLHYEIGGSNRKSRSADFTMMKTKDFMDLYLLHSNEPFKRILELGVYQGGSFVFFDQIFQPEKISAIELSTVHIPALDEYVEANASRAKVHYGTPQDDEARLAQIIDQDFGGTVDLVIDDASHFYDQTKASFKIAFPKIRPGGLYIIEDWTWSFQEPYQGADHPWRDHHSLANLVVDLMEEMVLTGLTHDISISLHMVKVRRSGKEGHLPFQTTSRRGRDYKPL